MNSQENIHLISPPIPRINQFLRQRIKPMKRITLITACSFIFLTTSAQIRGMENDQTQFENIIVYEESGDMQTTALIEGADQVGFVTWLPHLAPTNDTIIMILGTWNEKHSQKSCKHPDQKKYIDAISCVLCNIEDYIEQNKNNSYVDLDDNLEKIVTDPTQSKPLASDLTGSHKDSTHPEADNSAMIHIKRSDKVAGLSRKKSSNPLATDKDPICPQAGCCCVS